MVRCSTAEASSASRWPSANVALYPPSSRMTALRPGSPPHSARASLPHSACAATSLAASLPSKAFASGSMDHPQRPASARELRAPQGFVASPPRKSVTTDPLMPEELRHSPHTLARQLCVDVREWERNYQQHREPQLANRTVLGLQKVHDEWHRESNTQRAMMTMNLQAAVNR